MVQVLLKPAELRVEPFYYGEEELSAFAALSALRLYNVYML